METNIIDVIILSYTKNLYYYGLTTRTIESLRMLNPNISFNVILIETNKHAKDEGFLYRDINVITPSSEFNYNHFLNIGLNQCSADYILIINNDLIFSEHSIETMLNIMKNNSIKSASPIEPNWPKHKDFLHSSKPIEGYETGKELAGWCILLSKEVINTIGKFDENFKFWYQDNDYAENLKKHNIKHYLIPTARVYHVLSQSHSLIGDFYGMLNDNKQEMFKKYGILQ